MITIITGNRAVGKTSFILKKIQEISESGQKAYGIITPPLWDGQGRKIGFSAFNTATGEKWELARTDIKLPGPTYGPYHFSDKGFTRANNIIIQSLKQKKSIVFIDEIGPLELKHKEGYYPSLTFLAETGSTQNLYIVIRPELINHFTEMYIPETQYQIMKVTTENRDKLDFPSIS